MEDEVIEGEVIRVTVNFNYRLVGKPHHQDELVEALNESMQNYIIPSDMVSSNPRWVLYEEFREFVITGA